MTILNVIQAVEKQARSVNAAADVIRASQSSLLDAAQVLNRTVIAPAERAQITIAAHSIRRLQEQVQTATEPVRRAQEQFAAFAQSLHGISTTVQSFREPARQVAQVLETMAAPVRQFQQAFASIEASTRKMSDFAKQFETVWARAAQDMVEQFRRVERAIDGEVAKVLLRRGWLGIERHLTTWELGELLKLKGPSKGAKIDKFICSAFRRNRGARLRSMTRRWSSQPYLRDRRVIIRQACQAHLERRYALSIAAMLPLVDGLAAEIRKSNPKLAKPSGRRRLIAVTEVVTLYDTDRGRTRDWADAVLSAVTQRMFKDYDFDTERAPAKINRHGILHGRIPDYPSETNSLKALLLVDVMAYIAAS